MAPGHQEKAHRDPILLGTKGLGPSRPEQIPRGHLVC